MKYVEGEPLEQIIAKLRAGDPDYQHRFSFEVRTQIFMQLLHAMQYAHRRGVLHLDIKPANVLVGRFGEVVLVDWGIARAHAHAQAQAHSGENAATAPNGTDGAVVAGHRGRSAAISITGTPDYMSPEQAMGRVEDFGPHTDTYCLCVLFYELITLHHYLPPRETLEGRLTSILVDEPLSGIQMHHRYGSPPELSNYVRAGLGKEITDRYRTVDEMVDKLQAVIDGDIPVACPCTGIKRAANGYGDFMNDHPNLAIAGVVITSVFAVVGLVDVFRWVAAHI